MALTLEPVGRAGRSRTRPTARAGGGRYESIVDAIGHTPLVAIPRLSPDPEVTILAKLEGLNPTGSVKDRIARALIEDLEATGRLSVRTRSSSSPPAATPASRSP